MRAGTSTGAPPGAAAGVVLGVAVGFAAGVVAAIALLLAGPSDDVVCGTGDVLDQIGEDISDRLGGGHIDGPDASYCTVPTDGSWVAAAVAIAGASITGYGIGRRERSPRFDAGLPQPIGDGSGPERRKQSPW